MGLIKYLFGRSWRAMTFVSLAALVGGLAGAALVAVIGKAVVAQGDRTWLGVAFLGLCVLIVVTRAMSEVGLLRLTQEMVLQLRLSLSRKLLATPQKRLNEIGKDELMVIVTRDIDVFSNAFQVFPRVFSNLIVLAACLGYIAILSWSAFFVVLTCMIVCVGGYLLAERAPLRQLALARDQTERVQRAQRTLIEGSRELQLNAERTRHFLGSVLEKEARSYADLYTSSMARYAWTSNIGNVLFFQGIGAVLFLVPLFMPGITAQSAELTLVLLYIIRPISDLMFSVPVMRQAGISWSRVHRLEGQLTGGEAKLQEPDPFGHGIDTLELRDVCHRYQADSDDRFLLGPISMDIRRGEILFIIGGNGTGKTTLAMLLLGLFEPESGHIALNGVTVTDENRDNYRQRFSAIFSDGHLFEHLPVADSDETRTAATRYLRALHLPENVRINEGKFSTVHLSMGQRKRLALVSSYLEDRPIYVFDEWAADQDPMFKSVFYSQIAPDLKARGKTIIIISHDDAYFSCADRTIKLDAGRLHPAAA
jgi:putative pyoverdin transport system ATP-binding/permease protein